MEVAKYRVSELIPPICPRGQVSHISHDKEEMDVQGLSGCFTRKIESVVLYSRKPLKRGLGRRGVHRWNVQKATASTQKVKENMPSSQEVVVATFSPGEWCSAEEESHG